MNIPLDEAYDFITDKTQTALRLVYRPDWGAVGVTFMDGVSHFSTHRQESAVQDCQQHYLREMRIQDSSSGTESAPARAPGLPSMRTTAPPAPTMTTMWPSLANWPTPPTSAWSSPSIWAAAGTCWANGAAWTRCPPPSLLPESPRRSTQRLCMWGRASLVSIRTWGRMCKTLTPPIPPLTMTLIPPFPMTIPARSLAVLSPIYTAATEGGFPPEAW